MNPNILREDQLELISDPDSPHAQPIQPKIQDLDSDDRPFERAEKFGVSSLTDADLLALILRSGMPGRPVTTICRELMKAHSNRFRTLAHATPATLGEFKGIGKVKVFQILAIMEIINRYNRERTDRDPLVNSSEAAARLMHPVIGNEAVEHIYVIYLSQSLRLIKIKEISRGVSNATVFDVKPALRSALETGANNIMLCHNHPSGNMRPSPQDDQLTRNLKEACGILNIRLVDHVIVGGGTAEKPEFYSYHDNGKL